MRTLHSEWIAITTTRALAGHAAAALLLGLLPLLVLSVVDLSADAGGPTAAPDLATASGQVGLLSTSSTAYLLGAILGAVVATRRHRHRTIVGQLLVTPARPRAFGAQSVVVLLAAGLLGLFGSLVTLGSTTLGLSLAGQSLAVDGPTLVRIVAGAVLAGAVGGAIGNGVGAVVRNAGAAIAGVVLLALLVDGLVGAFLPEVGQWLPGALLARVEQGDSPFVPGDISRPVALVAVSLEGVAVLAAGMVATVRRDAV